MQTTNPTPLTVAQLASRHGISVPCTGNSPVNLDDSEFMWLIDQGTVNLFLIEHKDGVEQAAPQHLMSRNPGELIPGVLPYSLRDDDGTLIELVAKGSPDTVLKRLPVSCLSDVSATELASQIDAWLIALTDTLSRFTKPIPVATELAEPGVIETSAPSILSVRRDVAWVSIPPHNTALLMDIVDQMGDTESDVKIPLTRSCWINLLDKGTLTCKSTEEMAQDGLLIESLINFHAVALNMESLNRRFSLVDEVNLERARSTSRSTAEANAKHQLFNMYDLPTDSEDEDEDASLAYALEKIGSHEKIDFKIPIRSEPSNAPIELSDVLSASGVRARRVSLKEQKNWWWSDSGSLLAFRAEDDQPVALVPGMFGRYRIHDRLGRRSFKVTRERACALKDDAWMFYRPLPSGNITPAGLLKFALHGSKGDVIRLLFCGLPYALICMLPAFALGAIANQLNTAPNHYAPYALAMILVTVGVFGALLHMLKSTVILRMEARSTSRIEAALWDHLLRLPSNVLNRYTSGNLAMLTMTFQNVRDSVQGAVADSLLSILFLFPILVVIYFYDAALGIVAAGFSLAALLTAVVLGLRQIVPHRRIITAARRVAGRLLQIIGGINKLRVENAEASAFAIWAKEYREQKRAEIELGFLNAHSQAFSVALPFFAAGAMLFAVVAFGDRSAPISDFIVIYTVFIVFQSAITRVSESFGSIASIPPAFDQLRPLLITAPETEIGGEPVSFLRGDVLFDRVSYRYDSDSPMILDDVTIEAKPGEFIAVTGESGAGKSTLFRLALGIDQPTSGAVYYDGRDLKQLNLKQVRQKIGAVPQSVSLYPQDIWDNIIGQHESASNEEVWTAAATANIEKEIKSMPMGMMTMVGASGGVLSGGESQRVTIARSVLREPRIMLFDEATNWLDNENQDKIMHNLSTMTATRIVIAHRLSTLKQADRIYVLQAGQVVESGTFEELMEIEGVFGELVKRQIA